MIKTEITKEFINLFDTGLKQLQAEIQSYFFVHFYLIYLYSNVSADKIL